MLARAGYPDLDAHKLADLVEFFELEVGPRHRALADAEATAALLGRMAEDLPVRVNAFKAAVAESVRMRKGGGDTTSPTPPSRRRSWPRACRRA